MAEGNADDGLWMLFFVISIFCGNVVFIWFAFKPQLLQGYLWVRQGEMAVASLWTPDDKEFAVVIDGQATTMTFGEGREIVRTVTPEVLLNDDVNHWSIINATSIVALKPMRIPVGIIFAIMFYYAMFRSPQSQFRRNINLKSLMEIQSETFKIIKPFLNFNPLNDVKPRSPGSPVPAELPSFAEALGPEEWLAYKKVPMPDGQFDAEFAKEAMAQQLGQPWQGVKKLPAYKQVLLAAFALKASRKRQEADDLLGELAVCWDHKTGLRLDRGLVSKARKILKNKDLSGGTLAECNRHAYVTTALIGALDHARSEGGVLAPAQFLWLRGHDRDLWYPLNNFGRQSFHMEAVGAMSHYRAESMVKRPIPKPMLDDAIKALQGYMDDPQQRQPIPQLDFSMVKKKKQQDKNAGVMKPAGT